METKLIRESDWEPLDGHICRVTTFTPLGWLGKGARASIELETELSAEAITGYVAHKLDLQHLSEAFSRRESEPHSEVLIVWTEQYLVGAAKLVAQVMPRMIVMLCRKNTYELWNDYAYEPELVGQERYLAQKPIAQWRPETMESILEWE